MSKTLERPDLELPDLDTLIDELDERITAAQLPQTETEGDSDLCTVLVCDSVACNSVLICG
ncbi:MAG TPA: hypothetical protein VH372_09475 [Actinospica sp.]|jgi:hypothetical protein|nr:hypothetical protein [Actinospica sp.]